MDGFVGRKPELDLLNRLWNQSGARLLVLYGRRRVGKTRLMTQWIRQPGNRVIYWAADTDSKEAHLRQFSQSVFDYANPGFPAPDDFTYANWEQALSQVAQMAKVERLGLFIDEFTFLLQANEAVAGKFQKMWDQVLEDANIFLCLSGSHLGMMQRGVLSERAPLYGRASALHRLLPLPFGVTDEFFPGYSAEERVMIYAIFGGIPMYWNLIEQFKPLDDNIGNLMFTPSNIVDAEAMLLLHDFLSELHNYVAILRTIANGYNTLSEMEGPAGLDKAYLPAYLKVLSESGYVARYEPITARHPTRLGRYYITDPFLRFYFRFIASRRTQLAMNEPGQAYAEFKRHVADFIGTYTWEELCREWVLRASNRGVLPLYPDQVESAWTKETQVDVVGVNSMERHLILGECKWTNDLPDLGDLKDLVAKTQRMIPDNRRWQVYYLGFSKSGWTKAAEAYAATITQTRPEDANWDVAGCRLVTLEQLDHDLIQWAA